MSCRYFYHCLAFSTFIFSQGVEKSLRRDEQGLTLLEVVLSMAILSVVLLAFTSLFGSGFGASVQTGMMSRAAALAQEKMEVLRAHTFEELLAKGAELTGGDFTCPHAAATSPLKEIDGFCVYYSIFCKQLELAEYSLPALCLEVIIEKEGRQLARLVSFVPEGVWLNHQ